jgi:hypothetical protein
MSTRAKKDWLTPEAIVTPKIAKLAIDPLTENQLSITGTDLTSHQDALAYNHNPLRHVPLHVVHREDKMLVKSSIYIITAPLLHPPLLPLAVQILLH